MYRFAIPDEKKAHLFRNSQWHVISNPLYLRATHIRSDRSSGESKTPIDYILSVYPYPYDFLGLFSDPNYQGTLVSVYMQTEKQYIPRYLVWIDMIDCGEVVFAHDTPDIIVLMKYFRSMVACDVFIHLCQKFIPR